MTCDHKFVDSNHCLKCGVSAAELRASLAPRVPAFRDPPAVLSAPVRHATEPRPSVERLVSLQQSLMAVRDQLDRDGAEHAFGLTRVDIALISWALGLAHGYCLLNDRLDEREKVGA